MVEPHQGQDITISSNPSHPPLPETTITTIVLATESQPRFTSPTMKNLRPPPSVLRPVPSPAVIPHSIPHHPARSIPRRGAEEVFGLIPVLPSGDERSCRSPIDWSRRSRGCYHVPQDRRGSELSHRRPAFSRTIRGRSRPTSALFDPIGTRLQRPGAINGSDPRLRESSS